MQRHSQDGDQGGTSKSKQCIILELRVEKPILLPSARCWLLFESFPDEMGHGSQPKESAHVSEMKDNAKYFT